jgi:hypothetical protein
MRTTVKALIILRNRVGICLAGDRGVPVRVSISSALKQLLDILFDPLRLFVV